jgi:hypothetical protein
MLDMNIVAMEQVFIKDSFAPQVIPQIFIKHSLLMMCERSDEVAYCHNFSS